MKQRFVLAVMVIILLGSCGVRKNYAYLYDMIPGEKYPVKERKELLVKVDDRLDILVISKKPELAKPFNIRSAARVTDEGNIETPARSKLEGYKVDASGNIEFPLLGKLNVEGKTLQEVSDLIKNKLELEGHIKEPMVIVDILNFKYTVLGAIGKGVFTAEYGEVTLLEALAKAGDITSIGKLDRVAVIREIDGNRQIFFHDIRSKEIFNSPCYYLQQNDIVYVEPKYRTQTRSERGIQLVLMALSFLTTVSTSIILIKNGIKN